MGEHADEAAAGVAPPASGDGSARESRRHQIRRPRTWPAVVLLILGCQVVALLLTILGELVPDRHVRTALLEAIDSGHVTEVNLPVTGLDNQVDRWTECFALTMGLGDSASNPVESAISRPYLGRCDIAIPLLLESRDGDLPDTDKHYFRYWHGYSAITRPAIAATGIDGARTLAACLAIAAVAWTAVLVGRATSVSSSILLIAPVLTTSDFIDLGESLPHAIAAAACWGSAALVWVVVRQDASSMRIVTTCMAAGAAAAFFDLMVFNPGTLALVSILAVTAVRLSGSPPWELLRSGATAATSWFAGFVVTWASKWAIATTVVGVDTVVEDVRHTIGFRVGGEAAEGGALGEPTSLTLSYWFARPLGGLAIVGIIGVVVLCWILVRRSPSDRALALIVVGIGLVPLPWCEVLSGHTQLHYWITYKSLPMALGAVLFALNAARSSSVVPANSSGATRSLEPIGAAT